MTHLSLEKSRQEEKVEPATIQDRGRGLGLIQDQSHIRGPGQDPTLEEGHTHVHAQDLEVLVQEIENLLVVVEEGTILIGEVGEISFRTSGTAIGGPQFPVDPVLPLRRGTGWKGTP